MAAPEAVRQLGNRSEGDGNLPIPKLELSPLPPEIVRAFPALKEWEKQNNARLADWTAKMNTVQRTV